MKFAIANTLGIPAADLAGSKARLLLFDDTVEPEDAVKNWTQTATKCKGIIACYADGVYSTGQIQGVRDNKHYPATGGIPSSTTQSNPLATSNYTTLANLDTSNVSLGIKYGFRVLYASSRNTPPTWDSDGYGLPKDLMIISSKEGELKSEVAASVPCYHTRTWRPNPDRIITRTTTLNSYSILRGIDSNNQLVNLNFRIADRVAVGTTIAYMYSGVFYANRAIQGVYYETEYHKTSYSYVDQFNAGDAGYIAAGTVRDIPVYIDTEDADDVVVPTWAAIQVNSRLGESLLRLSVGPDGDFIPTGDFIPGKPVTLVENPNKNLTIPQHLQDL